MFKIAFLIIILFASSSTIADEISDISNYRQYSKLLSSSGQPSAKQLELVEKNGYELIVYLAFSDNQSAIKNEDRVLIANRLVRFYSKWVVRFYILPLT